MQVILISVSTPAIPECNTAEELVAYCARVSNPSNQANNLTAPKLLKYLVEHKHWSPFEMVSMCVEIVTTRDIARQILRHRSFSFQEFSARYAVVTSDVHLRDCRLQDTANRQNSFTNEDPVLEAWWDDAQIGVAKIAQEAYSQALEKGIAKEVARAVLPEGLTESRLYMSGTLRSFIHYCQIRTGVETQQEHREVAQAIAEVVLSEFPVLSEVFA